MRIEKLPTDVFDELEPPQLGQIKMNKLGCIAMDIRTYMEILKDDEEISYQIREVATALRVLREIHNEN